MGKSSWAYRFEELIEFKQLHGHCRVPATHLGLGSWVRRIRRERRSGALAQNLIDELDAIGFDWYPREGSWEEQFDLLKAFHNEFGHCRVSPKDEKLHRWLSRQKRFIRAGKLNAKKQRALAALGIGQKQAEPSWDTHFAKLQQFAARFGHCDIGKAPAPYRWLGPWIRNQRALRKSGKLSESRVQALTELGLIWDWNTSRWDLRFSELQKFRKRFGHCQVPQNWPENPSLANWTCSQRSRHRHGEMSTEQRERLEKLGFAWEVNAWPPTRTKRGKR